MKNDQKTLSLQSTASSIHQLERLIEEVCDKYNLNHNYLGCITVALTEAFQNALKHGNNNDPEKLITIQFEKTSSGLYFNIQDEGNGFDYNSIPNMKEDGTLKTFPGRGIFLIKSLSDDVQFIGKGNEISIGFKISSINFETAIDRISKFKEYTDTIQNINDLQ